MGAPRLERLSQVAEAPNRKPPLSFWQMPEKIYHLSLKWKPVENIPNRFALEVRLDDTLLIDLVREWELKHVPEQDKGIAGGYAQLRPWHTGLLRAWLGEPIPETEYSDVSGKTALLSCACCGIVDCWPLLVDIAFTQDHTSWSDFLQPFRRKSWSYGGFGPFTFHRAQYEAEVRRAMADAPA